MPLDIQGDAQNGHYVNQKEIRIIGMSRSGNHAIINWMFQQSPGKTCFLNCAEGKTNPFQSARPLSAEGDVYQVNYDGFDLAAERAGRFSPKDTLIYSYEDSFLRHVFNPEFEENHDRWVGPSRQRYDVLILRDPFNLFASRLRSGINGVSLAVSVRIWKQHAREFLGERSHLTYNRTCIRYNRWCVDAAYRKQLAERLGLTFTDDGFNVIPRTGEGSSFDGYRYDGHASHMKVSERWKHYRNNPKYRRLFQNDEQLVSLSQEIFGHVPGTEVLYEGAERATAA